MAAGGASGGPSSDGALHMGLLPDLIGFHLRCAQVAFFQHFSRSTDSADISLPQFGALVLIEANPGMSQSAIASALRFDRSTLVQIIDRLEDRGFVVREVSAHDRRSHALKLTPEGEIALSDLKNVIGAHEDHMTRVLTSDEKQQLLNLLARIHQAPQND